MVPSNHEALTSSLDLARAEFVECPRLFPRGAMMAKRKNAEARKSDDTGPKPEDSNQSDIAPDWDVECEVCGASPIVPATGLCGPCTFGDSSTVGGNW